MITIQKARVEDVTEIKKLLYETWTATYSEIYSPEAINTVTSQWHSIHLLTKQIQDSSICFYVAKDTNKIVGMCNAKADQEENSINIQRLHVLPQYQRQGIGSMLMNMVTKAFPKASKIDLEVEKQNHRASAFYKKMGFQEKGKKTFQVDSICISCIIMEKSVDPSFL